MIWPLPGSSRAVRITGATWEIIESPPAMFVRPDSMQPLSEPISGGSIEPLWRVANIPHVSRLMALAWMIECLRPDTPYPLLELLGDPPARSRTRKNQRNTPNKLMEVDHEQRLDTGTTGTTSGHDS